MQNEEQKTLLRLIRRTRDGRLRVRYLAILNFLQNKNRAETARQLNVARNTVNKWVKIYLTEGIEGLKEKTRSGRPLKLSESQLTQLSEYIKEKAKSAKGGRLTGKKIGEYIKETFGVDYSLKFGLTGIYRLLHSLGFSWITSRSRHPKQSDEVQENFKKNFSRSY